MAKREPRSIKIHHIFFAAGCAGLLATTVWAFYNDYFQREYPKYQQDFNQVEIDRLSGERQKAWDEWNDLSSESKELEAAQKKAQEEVRKSERALRRHRDDVHRINDDLALIKRKLNFAGTDTGVLNWDWLAAKEGKDKAYEKVAEHAKYTRDLFNQVQEKLTELGEHEKEIAVEENKLKDANKKLAGFDGRLLEVMKAVEKAKGNPVLNFIKDAPGLDFIAPRWNLNDQLVLPNLPVDVLFAKTQRVDRCVVCHKGIDNADPSYKTLDAEKKVLRSHPRLDLFVSADSKHPMKVFGCTVCHQGRGMGVSFLRSAHTPQNHEQGEKWRKDYGWNTLDQHAPGQPLWDAPMLPLQYTEASCAKCHKGVDHVPQAVKLNKGREIFRERGCVNCHIGTTDADMAWMGRIGPDLRHISEKVDMAWTRTWIENPWKFRPDTKMPRIFGLENRKEPDGRVLQLKETASDANNVVTLTGKEHPRDPVEIEAISTYLFASSKLRERKLPEPPKGDAAKGKQVFSQVGCLACHSTSGSKDKYTFNNHGPDLSRIGEKVHPSWLFDWLKNPKHYWAETRMPSLRLSDTEAADLTAYLLSTMKSEGAAPPQLDAAPAWAYDSLIRDLLLNNTPDFQIAGKLANADVLVRSELRKKVKYGVKPGETAKSDLGVGEWSEAQIDAVMKVLDGMGQDEADKVRVKKAFFSGSALIQQYGCYACHNIQGWTNAPLSCVNLNGEGDKDVAKFAFGQEHIPLTRWDWVYLKLARPRVFDQGALEITKPLDRLRMPWFGYEKGSAHEGGASEGHGEGHGAQKKVPSKVEQNAAGGGAHAHGTSSVEVANANPDETEGHGLSHEDIESLVTVVLSYTNEPIPMDMMKQPTPAEVAMDRGERVIRSLNCIGCHLVGLDKPVAQLDKVSGQPDLSKRGQVPLASLLTREAQSSAKTLGMFSDRDEFSLTHEGAVGFLHFGRGTFVTEVTVPILLGELDVRRSPTEPPVRLAFRFLKERDVKKLKEGQDRWVTYGSLVTEEQFLKTTAYLFEGKADEASKSYNKYKDQFVNLDAYERLAGTAALLTAPDEGLKITEHTLRAKLADGTAWPAYSLSIRWTQGEGKLVPHFIATEGSQQQAPPSLTYEGGKVQPDWFYSFLRNVQPLRPTLNIRMPSFWMAGNSTYYKTVYPAGRASAVNAEARPTSVDGEPAPGPDSPATVPDDSQQIIEYFNATSRQKPFGYQPVPVMTEDSRKAYQTGYNLLFPADPKTNPGGVSCTSCHSVGLFETPAPKGPNLMVVKRRFKDEWLLRFLTSPQAMYPWANMPANFYDWGSYEYTPDNPLRNMAKGDEKTFKEITDKVNAVRLFLLSSGEAEIGTTPAPGAKKP